MRNIFTGICVASLIMLVIAVVGCSSEKSGTGDKENKNAAPKGGEEPKAGVAQKTDKVAAKVQTLCPVMGNPINKSLYADYNGKRVYFCCPGCIEEFKKDPEKHIKQLESQGIQLEATPKE